MKSHRAKKKLIWPSLRLNLLKTLKSLNDPNKKAKMSLSNQSLHLVKLNRRLQSCNRLKFKIHPIKSTKIIKILIQKKRQKLKKAWKTSKMDFLIQLATQLSNRKIELVSRVVITEGERRDTEETSGGIEEEEEADKTLISTEMQTIITIGEETKKLLEKSLEKMILRRNLAIRNLR